MLIGYRIYIDNVLTETHLDKKTSDTININIPANINSFSIIFYFENFNSSNDLMLTDYSTYINASLEYLCLKNLSCNYFPLEYWIGTETDTYIDLINSHINYIDCYMATKLFNLTIRGDLTSTLTSCVNGEDSCFDSIDVNVNGLTNFDMRMAGSLNYVTVNTKNITNFSYMFECSQVPGNIKLSDTSNGTNFSGMFIACSNITSIPFLDTSNGTNFSRMFDGCFNLTTIPLLDTSKGTNFSDMFVSCGITSMPLLDTSNGTDFSGMFWDCFNLTTIPLLDTSKGTNFGRMFKESSSLTSIPQLDTSNGTYFGEMFTLCISLKSVPLLDASNVTSTLAMFDSCYALTNLGGFKGLKVDLDLSLCERLTHESLMNVINNLAVVDTDPILCLSSTSLDKLTDDEKAIAINKGWILA